jgi:hypothetical protein
MTAVVILPALAFLIAFSNVSLIFAAPDAVMGTNGSLLTSAGAVIASASSWIALGSHRGYRTSIALNVVAALLGAVDIAVVASNDWHPRPADILAILSAAACGASVPHLLQSKRRRTIVE